MSIKIREVTQINGINVKDFSSEALLEMITDQREKANKLLEKGLESAYVKAEIETCEKNIAELIKLLDTRVKTNTADEAEVAE